MGLIKIKKKPQEPINENDSKFKKLWKDPKSHALIVLGLYLVFFILIFIFLALSKPANNNIEKDNNDKIKNMFSNLEEKENLTYNYIIKSNNVNYLFNGSLNSDNNITGKLVTDDKNIQIKIENEKCTVGSYDENNEFIPMYEQCPENIEYKYFDMKNIYSIIKNKKSHKNVSNKYYEIKIDDNTKLELHYNLENNEEELSKIIIKGNNGEYELTYKTI